MNAGTLKSEVGTLNLRNFEVGTLKLNLEFRTSVPTSDLKFTSHSDRGRSARPIGRVAMSGNPSRLMSPSAKPYADPCASPKLTRANVPPLPSLKKTTWRARGVAEHDVWTSVVVEISGRDRIRRLRLVGDAKSRREPSLAVVEIHDHRCGLLITHDEIERAVAVEIRGGADTRHGVRRTERRRPREPRLAVVEVDATLPAVAARHRQIDETVLVEVRRHDARRRLGRNADARAREAASPR